MFSRMGSDRLPAKNITLFCQQKKRAMETTEKVDEQCKGGHGDKEISFPSIQNTVE